MSYSDIHIKSAFADLQNILGLKEMNAKEVQVVIDLLVAFDELKDSSELVEQVDLVIKRETPLKLK